MSDPFAAEDPMEAMRRQVAAWVAKGRRKAVLFGKVPIGVTRKVFDASTGLETTRPLSGNEYVRALIATVLEQGEADILRMYARFTGKIVGTIDGVAT